MRFILSMLCLLVPLVSLAEEPKTIRENWQKHCKKCHGDEGEATKIGLRLKSPENIYEEAQNKTVEEILETIRDGKNKMPAFNKKLTEQEMNELAVHIEYSSLVKKVLDKRERIQRELKNIQRDYKVLPECENGL
tara:strand:+ start:4808 stop:5212 length:405 start_codon:yes stop_codon:yes gene_type:complete